MSVTSEDSDDFVDAQESPSINDESIDDNDNGLYPLHRAVFEQKPISYLNEIMSSSSSSTSDLIKAKDCHGNTALHLAIMLGHKEHINFLLKHNSPIKTKNGQGWTPLDEAISYGDRKIIKNVLRLARKQARQSLKDPKIFRETLKKIPDFQMNLRWEFYSWIPYLKRFLPSNINSISKKGAKIRLELSFLALNERGNFTFLLNCGKNSPDSVVMLDNDLKVYQYCHQMDLNDAEIDEDVDRLMSSDLVHLHLNRKSIAFNRAQAGWFFARHDKTEKVGNFEADVYNMNGLTMETLKRREHLSEEDIQSNKALLKTLKKSLDTIDHHKKRDRKLISKNKSSPMKKDSDGGNVGDDDGSFEEIDPKSNDGSVEESKNGNNVDEPQLMETNMDAFDMDDCLDQDENELDEDLAEVKAAMISATNDPIEPRQSLPPPIKPDVSWNDYINAPKGSPPCLGRPWKLKKKSQTFKATVAMSQEFPLTIQSFLDIMELIEVKHFTKLKEFVTYNLPPGFPVKIDIPVLPAIFAKVTFTDFKLKDDLDDHLFEIPADYTEDPDRFSDL